MKKKILFVANVGKEHILKFHVPTIKYFKDNDWMVDVACSGVDVIPYVDNQYVTSWKRSPLSLKTIIGIRELKKIINQEYYNIIYCHTPVGGLIARVAAIETRRKGTVVVYFAHGFHFYKGAPKLNWLIYYNVEKYLSKHTDKIIVINNEDYIKAKKSFKTVNEIYLSNGVGVDIDKYINIEKNKVREKYRRILNISDEALVLIYVAELNENKNQQMLINVVKEAKSALGNVILLLVGPDHSNGSMIEIADKLGVSNQVYFLGWRSDIGELLSIADIYVASSKREGLPINIIESILCKVPVIATDNRGHRSIIENDINGFIVPINDYKSMSDMIVKLINNELLYNEITNNASKKIDIYNENTVISDLYKFITFIK